MRQREGIALLEGLYLGHTSINITHTKVHGSSSSFYLILSHRIACLFFISSSTISGAITYQRLYLSSCPSHLYITICFIFYFNDCKMVWEVVFVFPSVFWSGPGIRASKGGHTLFSIFGIVPIHLVLLLYRAIHFHPWICWYVLFCSYLSPICRYCGLL